MPAPATVAEAVALVEAALPDVETSEARAIEGGWDSFVLEAGGEWIFRFPRRPEVEAALRAEIALLPLLAPSLPAAIPQFVHVVEEPALFVGYRKIRGAPPAPGSGSIRTGRDLGAFLGALHAFPVETARAAGVPFYDPAGWRALHEELFETFRNAVGPLLPRRERAAAEGMFAAFLDDDANFDFVPALLHYDLGPTHLLVAEDGALSGVIDWGDAAAGDPAADLAWALHGSGPAFADAVYGAYPGSSSALRERALLYHRLGPWHEVVHGQETGAGPWIESGLRGVIDRLPREPRAAR